MNILESGGKEKTVAKKEQLEMKNDGHDAERFAALLKTVVNVPKEKIKEREEQEKKEKDERAKA